METTIYVRNEVEHYLEPRTISEEEMADIIERSPKRYGRVTDGLEAAKSIMEYITGKEE